MASLAKFVHERRCKLFPAWPEGPDRVGPPPPTIDALHDAPHEASIVAVLLSTAWL
jgi:hypothetical protein